MTNEPGKPSEEAPSEEVSLNDFEESGEAAHERRERWGDHEPGGATTPPGGYPAGAEEADKKSTAPAEQ